MTSTGDEARESVSREAHQRMTEERDKAVKESAALQQQLADAKRMLTDTNLVFEAQSFFQGKVANPVEAAKMVLPDLRDVAASEDRAQVLAQKLGVFAPNDAVVTPAADQPEPDTVPNVPAPAFMAPSPATTGPPPPPDQYSLQSEQGQRLLQSNDWEAVKRAIDAGEVAFHPQVDQAIK